MNGNNVVRVKCPGCGLEHNHPQMPLNDSELEISICMQCLALSILENGCLRFPDFWEIVAIFEDEEIRASINEYLENLSNKQRKAFLN